MRPCVRGFPEIHPGEIRKAQIADYRRNKHGRGAAILGDEHQRGGSKGGGELHFGNIGVVICGEFAHLRPVEKNLIAPISAESSRVAAKLGNDGRGIFDTFIECAKFRVIYRQGAPCPFKESARRLRDCAMTLADYDIWQSRDIASDKCPEDLKARDGNFIWLCEENAATGEERR